MMTYHKIRYEAAKLFYEDLYNQFVIPSADEDFDEREFNITSSVILHTKLLDQQGITGLMKIGAGSYGIVFSADYQGKPVAVKCPLLNFVDGLEQFISTVDRSSENLHAEYKFLEQINRLCPNITVKVNQLIRFGPINYIVEEFFGEPLQCVMFRDHQLIMDNFDKIAQGIMTCVE